MIIAVTRNDETNMIVCQLANLYLVYQKKLPEYELKIFQRENGVNYLTNQIFQQMSLCPPNQRLLNLYRRLEAPGALDNVPFGKNKVKMLEISIEKPSKKNIPLKKLTEKFPDFKANILGAQKRKFIYLKKDDQMLEDNVYVVVVVIN